MSASLTVLITFAANEDLTLAVAGGDAGMSFTCLPRPIDHTAHYGDPQRDLQAFQ